MRITRIKRQLLRVGTGGAFLNFIFREYGFMSRTRTIGLLAVAVAIAAGAASLAQEREDRTLLTHAQMTAIVNEASGERAMHTVLELVPYQRVRPLDEYKGHFRESQVMAQMAKDYGFSNVTIESFAEGQAWQPTVGGLWVTTQRELNVYGIHALAFRL